MKIYYRILNLNAQEHSIGVRYWSDTVSENQLAVEFNEDQSPKLTAEGFPTHCRTDYNITLYDLPVPKPEDIFFRITQAAPVKWFEILENVALEIATFTYVLDMQGTTGTITTTTISQDISKGV